MIEFILNNQKIKTDKHPGSTILDFIRNDARLMGTKIGCREGDCGACTVLIGSLESQKLTYHSIVSCLSPLINAHGKHIVTIEGLEMEELNPAQKAMENNAATQCGFCTPGFVMALTGNLLSNKNETAKESMSGNICRCTGYKSIERAGEEVDKSRETLLKGQEIDLMIERGWLPEYFSSIENRLKEIPSGLEEAKESLLIGGGTDIMVQKPEKVRSIQVQTTFKNIPSEIKFSDGQILIGAGIHMSAFFEHPIINEIFPGFQNFYPLIASRQIRNMGTLGGNIVNASPIGDTSILFLALNADLILSTGRKIALKDFFLDYKKIDLEGNEHIHYITIDEALKTYDVHFEKVSKRTYLDIASVNSALSIKLSKDIIEDAFYAAGGVAAFPKYMAQSCEFLKGKKLTIETLRKVIDILQNEISPISDIRGSKDYKLLLIRQLFLSHIMSLYPEMFEEQEILELMTTKNTAL